MLHELLSPLFRPMENYRRPDGENSRQGRSNSIGIVGRHAHLTRRVQGQQPDSQALLLSV
jgi:hypothetical protein